MKLIIASNEVLFGRLVKVTKLHIREPPSITRLPCWQDLYGNRHEFGKGPYEFGHNSEMGPLLSGIDIGMTV